MSTWERAVDVVAQLRDLPEATRDKVFELLLIVFHHPTTPDTEPRIGLQLLDLLDGHPTTRAAVSSYLSVAWERPVSSRQPPLTPHAAHLNESDPDRIPASELLDSLTWCQ